MEDYITSIIIYMVLGVCLFSFYLPTAKNNMKSNVQICVIFLRCITIWPFAILYAFGWIFVDAVEKRKKENSKSEEVT